MSFPTQFHVYRKLNRILARLKEELRGRGFPGPRPMRTGPVAQLGRWCPFNLSCHPPRPVPVTHLDPAIIAAYVERAISW